MASRKRAAEAAADSPDADRKRQQTGSPDGGPKFKILRREILARSEAEDWEQAKQEWTLEHLYWSRDDPKKCLCSHFPIHQVCVIEHESTEERVEVGNCCVKRFLNLPSDSIFSSVHRVWKEGHRALNEVTVNFAYEHDWITDWEYEFYLDTFRKRSPTERQQEQRERINEKIIERMSGRSGGSERIGAWQLGQRAINHALAVGAISQWEAEFYLGNILNDFVTSRQKPIKLRIEEKVMCAGEPLAWSCDARSVADALAAGQISEWEERFFAENVHKARLSEKQLEIKQRLEAKVAASGGGNVVYWSCNPVEVAGARAAGRLTDWEESFFHDNIGKRWLSEKQLQIKERIENKIASFARAEAEAGDVDAATLAGARSAGRITEWDESFYLSIRGKQGLSEKQAWVKERIEKQISGLTSAPSVAAASASGVSWPHDLAAAQRALQERRISEWDHKFYTNNIGKPSLSEKQLQHKSRIDAQIAGASKGQPCSARSEADSHAQSSSALGAATLSAPASGSGNPSSKGCDPSTREAAPARACTGAGSDVPRTVASLDAGASPSASARPAISPEQRARIEQNRLMAMKRRQEHMLREVEGGAAGVSAASSRVAAASLASVARPLLSAEQRALIERNRLAALERRRSRMTAQALEPGDAAASASEAKEGEAAPGKRSGVVGQSLLAGGPGASPAEPTPAARPALTSGQMARIEQNRLAALERKRARELHGAVSEAVPC